MALGRGMDAQYGVNRSHFESADCGSIICRGHVELSGNVQPDTAILQQSYGRLSLILW